MFSIKFEFLVRASTILVVSTLSTYGQRTYGLTQGTWNEYIPQGLGGGYSEYKPEGMTSCKSPPVEIPTEWITMTPNCNNMMEKHSANELRSSLQYLALGAFFSREFVNRAGFAEDFLERAGRKRQNVLKVIDYLSMRGNMTDYQGDVLKLFPDSAFEYSYQMQWESLAAATEFSLLLESKLTDSLREVIRTCQEDQGFSDFHASDWVLKELLDEQYTTKRHLADLLTELRRMEDQGRMGEMLVDWEVQSGTIFK